MLRSLIVVLGCTAPVLAQYRDEAQRMRPPQFGGANLSGTPYLQPRFGSLFERLRQLDRPISTGLVYSDRVDEAMVDVEAWLRDPIPSDEVALRRIGFRRPPEGSTWRTPITLPDEDTIRRDEYRLRNTITAMQGFWRVEVFILDGVGIEPENFAGLKYLVHGTVLFQSETSEQWERGGPIPPRQRKLQPVIDKPRREPGELNEAIREASDPPVEVGPAGVSRPAGAVLREDPRQEEGTRLLMLFRNEGQSIVYGWDRYGSSTDPYNELNRPSARVVLPAIGALEVGQEHMILGIRGTDMWGLLPTRFHKDRGFDRTVFLRMARDVAHSKSIGPEAPPTVGRLPSLPLAPHVVHEWASADRPRSELARGASTGSWVVRPPTRVQLLPAPADAIVKEPGPSPRTVSAGGSGGR